MERLNTNVGSLDGPLQETPKVLQPVRVDRTINIPFSMIDDLMLVIAVHALIGAEFIRVKGCARLHVLADRAVDVPFAAMIDRLGVNLAGLSFQQAEYDGLAEYAATVNLFLAFISMHVAGCATDEGLVSFDGAGHLVDGPVVLGVPNPMEHKPCRLLGYVQRARDLVGRNAVLAVRQQPHGAQPLVQADSAILEDRADLDRELLPAPETRPHQPRFEKRELFGLAARAFRAIRPLCFGNSFQADHGVRKVPDSRHQATVNIEFFCFHGSSIRLEAV